MSIQKKISQAKEEIADRTGIRSAAGRPSTESDLLLEGRTAMHAPEIDGKGLRQRLSRRKRAERRRVSTVAASLPPTIMTWWQRSSKRSSESDAMSDCSRERES
jgi:hypothetical protein